MWDAVIRGGTVFDGSGALPRRLDVALQDGRVAALGENLPIAEATTVIDADGQWVMPGLLDIHTHLDLEVEVDPGLCEPLRHGTTTAVMSNCSLGLAFGAQTVNGQNPIVDCFARVEGMPKHSLQKVVDKVDWSDSAGYLEHLDQLPLGLNVVPMIPHSMLRIEVMGLQASVTRQPTANEIEQMAALVDKGMREGYAGFSTDELPFHYLSIDPNRQRKIPGQLAPYREFKRLLNVVRRYGRVWQATPQKDEPLTIARNFSLTSGRLHGRPLKLTAVAALDLITDRSIAWLGFILTRVLNSRLVNGHFRFQALPCAFKMWHDGALSSLAEELPTLRRLAEIDVDDRESRIALLNDPAYVEEFRHWWNKGKSGWSLARLRRVLRLEETPLTRKLADQIVDKAPVSVWVGESMQQIYERLRGWQANGEGARDEQEAEAFGSFPRPTATDFDFYLHLLRRYDRDLRWYCYIANVDKAVVKKLMFDPHMLPGFNDSGAHMTNMAFYDANLRGLKLAQEEGVERVAEAVRRFTSEPAEFFGLDVGRIGIGTAADVIVVDPNALAAWESEQNSIFVRRECYDFDQVLNRSDGVVKAVFVNGQLAWDGGDYTAAVGHERLGRCLRSVEAEEH